MISEPILEVPGVIFKAKLREAEFFVCDDPRSATQALVLQESESWPKLFGLPIKHVVDLGANCGFFSFYIKKLFPSAIIDAVEPVESIGNSFEFGRILNNFDASEVRLHRHAIGQNISKLYMPIANTGAAGAYNLLNSRVPLVSVDTMGCISLEEFFKPIEHCDFLKVDIEGAEFIAFDGFTQAHKIERIFLETHLFPFCNEEEAKERALLWPFFEKLKPLFEGKQIWVAVEKRLQNDIQKDFPWLTVLKNNNEK